jgi:benzoyl-CoA reductase/2-hydroxyglutaryl-CoA dehydratase subunit BcrC/BadD/HgdB
MTAVCYTSPFVPPELIAACGLTPFRLVPAADADARREGLCSFMSAWLDTLEHRHAAGESFACVFCSACDQMRRAYDVFSARHPERTFLLNVPATTTENAFAYYRQELTRLLRFLCRISEQQPDWTRIAPGRTAPPEPNVFHMRIAVTGEATADSILSALRSVAGRFNVSVLDLTENAISPDIFSGLEHDADPLESVAIARFAVPAIWRRPNTRFFQWLSQSTHDHPVSGIVVLRHSFCDLWRAAKPEMIRQLSLPVLELDLDGSVLSQWMISRIEAFMETLR